MIIFRNSAPRENKLPINGDEAGQIFTVMRISTGYKLPGNDLRQPHKKVPFLMSDLPLIQIGRHPSSKGYRLETRLLLKESIGNVFEFFSNVHGLETLTPPWLNFKVRSMNRSMIGEGAEIDYKLRVHGIPLRWKSRILDWDPPFRFVDEQIVGPYRWWHHEHQFVECDEGTWVTDRVDYGVPLGWLSHRLIVSRDLQRIFRFRHEKLLEQFTCDSS